MFEDRTDAGEKLARALEKYKNEGVLVLAIPRGGVEVGYQVAKYLNADLSIVVTRKLPLPHNPEAGFGAIAENGSAFIFEDAKRLLSEDQVEKVIEEQKREVVRRVRALRGGRPLPVIKGRTVILVDDGIAMGSTMIASIILCKSKGAGKIIVASPVSSEEVANQIGRMVDEIVVLTKPPYFRAVAQVYRYWYDVPDKEVINILDRWEKEKDKKSN
ncbi:MAG: phosphoribosyltransferase [Candidatus Coatesbacteria bacterium 4484_99]|uniref:Phosphoribosyltransferase n=1 Tax=Candidatus Coatesbacteria bacterium 4484_99 TaxID=1970774 RepID=A0A1W9S2E7_9BACT|nr:MAG: phosphoribosyltransferase [Candidatus Coatesbacteria bacterium 4484_99]